MIFAPVRLGETSLNAEAVAADKKSCKRFGPCGVGKEALFLNSYFIDRRYYVAFSSVRRVFKRVAMSQGGFSGQGVFGAIPYLVVQYDGGKEKQCTFKREEDVDAMLAYIGKVHPEIPTLSVGGEQRLEQKAKEEAARYLSELTSDAQSAKEELEKAQATAKELEDKVVTIKVKTGGNGKLFGSVTNKEVAEEIVKQTKLDIDKKKVSIGDPIKMLGERTAVIKLHPKVTAEVKVKIVEA